MLNLRLSGEGFTPPGTKDFNLPSLIEGNPYFTKPILQLFLAVILISVFFILASRKAAVVPSKLQFAGESVYGFVRKGLGEDIIGHEFMRFVPFLFTLFTFILVNNIFRNCSFDSIPINVSRFIPIRASNFCLRRISLHRNKETRFLQVHEGHHVLTWSSKVVICTSYST